VFQRTDTLIEETKGFEIGFANSSFIQCCHECGIGLSVDLLLVQVRKS
jgi:hypothetical protein